MNIKQRAAGLFVAASLVTGLVAVGAAPAAHAVTVEQCGGFFFFATIIPPLAGNGDVTATVVQAKSAKAGVNVWFPGFGAQVAPPATLSTGAKFTVPGTVGTVSQGACGGGFINDNTMTIGTKLSGAASCDSTNTTVPIPAYPLNGKLALANVAKTVKEQVYTRVAGFDTGAGPDVISITGTDVKGLMPGASVSGEVGFDPVVKALVATPGLLPGPDGFYGPPIDAGSAADNVVITVPKNDYYFDNSQVAAACGSTGGGSIGLVFGTDTTTLLGSNGVPITFDL